MGNVAIRVEGLSKQYFIGSKQERYRTFRDTIADAVTAPVRRVTSVVRGRANSAAGNTETIWALKDISFDVKHGEVVGIIGRNGAGKSTLLKVLSRITEPTEGRIKINGRIGALLEVGTGFHPELTGRENIYLNGAVLGMSRYDIERKFDEIVDFAGVEKFVDTPVKYYSSGMGLRLGFAVAAHLEPDILIVDEVLAVGDAEFQKKCINKMNDVAGTGRTVLFVSHNMTAVNNLCPRSILLNRGSILKDGDTSDILLEYQKSYSTYLNQVDLRTFQPRHGTGDIKLVGIEVRDEGGNVIPGPVCGSTAQLVLRYERFDKSLDELDVAIKISDPLGNTKLVFASTETLSKMHGLGDQGEFVCIVPRWPLKPGDYMLDLRAHVQTQYIDSMNGAVSIQTLPGDFYGTGATYWADSSVLYEHHWLHVRLSSPEH